MILSFHLIQGKYIKSLPLHNSQQILIDNEEELRIKLTLFITHDLLMVLFYHGHNMRVLQYDNLISGLKLAYENALKLYDGE